jgi:nicotinic acid mononucleotide adenylyltransferase
VQTQLGLDDVVLMVANEPWQKVGDRQVTPANVRWEMTNALVQGNSGDDSAMRKDCKTVMLLTH